MNFFLKFALMGLYPYVMLFVNAITSNWGTIETLVIGLAQGIEIIAGVLATLTEGALSFAGAVIDNWSWISPIIYGIAAALAAYLAIATIVTVINGIHAMSEAVKAAAQTLATGATFAETAAQHGLNAALLACPITWIVLGILALIVVIMVVSSKIAEMTGIAESGFGVICGGVNVVIAFFKNLGLSVANIAIGIGYAIATLGENIMTAFHNAICSVQSWWYNLLSTVLTVVAGICEALNKLPFVEFDYSGITSAADEYANKSAETAGNKEDYKSISDAFNKGYSTFDAYQEGWVSDAFDAGAAWGDGIADKVSNFNLTDLFNTEDIPSADDLAASLNTTGVAGNTDDISKNTSSLKDITEEDLKYLRDIAEQEAVNRYTLAEVNIEQTNNNSISSGMDLDGVVSGLTDAVDEAVEIITEGVHA